MIVCDTGPLVAAADRDEIKPRPASAGQGSSRSWCARRDSAPHLLIRSWASTACTPASWADTGGQQSFTGHTRQQFVDRDRQLKLGVPVSGRRRRGQDEVVGFRLSTSPAIPAGSLAEGPQPVLAAPGDLVLRPWEPSDAPVFFSAYQDPAIQHWHTRQPVSEDQVREWFEQYRENWAQETGASWAVTRGGDHVLGRVAMSSLNLDDGVAGCAYWVLPAARGAGVAPRALTALSAWALGPTGFHRLHLDHSTRNHASCRVAIKAGFRWEGTKRSDAIHSDGRHDMHLHARIRRDN